ncbi:MAG: FAD-linked oxidase C-terminal domain-containing protein, partial [Pseudomonadota bacterium]
YCTVGGNIAHNAAGPRSLKYGATRENVLGLTAVTGDGRLIHTGGRTSKQATGYDFTRLLIGSEGTLAIVTEAILKLIPRPEARRTLQAVYRDITSATAAIARIMAQSVTPCALEFMDATAIGMIRDYSTAELPTDAGALLMIDVDGSESGLNADVEAIRRAATVDGLLRIATARDNTEAEALWATRKALSPALRKLAPNKLNEDVVVPVSRIPELIAGLERLSREYGIPIVNFGHAGNGNIHVNLLYDTQDPTQEKNALPCLSRVFDLVLSLDGTLSGEHGIGLAKRDYIDRAIDPDTLALMRAVKRDFDPKGILNPGKLFADNLVRNS